MSDTAVADTGTPPEYATLFCLTEPTGRQIVGFCKANEDGPMENFNGYVEVHNPLHVMMQLVRTQEGITPNVDIRPINLVGWLETFYMKVCSFYECKGALADAYSEKYKEYIGAITKTESLIQPAKSVSPADIRAHETVQRMKVK